MMAPGRPDAEACHPTQSGKIGDMNSVDLHQRHRTTKGEIHAREPLARMTAYVKKLRACDRGLPETRRNPMTAQYASGDPTMAGGSNQRPLPQRTLAFTSPGDPALPSTTWKELAAACRHRPCSTCRLGRLLPRGPTAQRPPGASFERI